MYFYDVIVLKGVIDGGDAASGLCARRFFFAQLKHMYVKDASVYDFAIYFVLPTYFLSR